jgi:hypothetical protein
MWLYLDVGMGLYAWLLSAPTVAAMLRKRAVVWRAPLLRIYIALLAASALWPIVPLLWLLGLVRMSDDD